MDLCELCVCVCAVRLLLRKTGVIGTLAKRLIRFSVILYNYHHSTIDCIALTGMGDGVIFAPHSALVRKLE